MDRRSSSGFTEASEKILRTLSFLRSQGSQIQIDPKNFIYDNPADENNEANKKEFLEDLVSSCSLGKINGDIFKTKFTLKKNDEGQLYLEIGEDKLNVSSVIETQLFGLIKNGFVQNETIESLIFEKFTIDSIKIKACFFSPASGKEFMVDIEEGECLSKMLPHFTSFQVSIKNHNFCFELLDDENKKHNFEFYFFLFHFNDFIKFLNNNNIQHDSTSEKIIWFLKSIIFNSSKGDKYE